MIQTVEIKTFEQLHHLYRQSHRNPKRFLGYTTKMYVEPIKSLIEATGAKTLLDYGSEKGYQYLRRRVHEQWGGILPHCYDPGVVGLAEKPEGTFDGVICCDVMEHIPEALVDTTVAELFSYAKKFVLLGISVVSSHKSLADGTNAHCTVREPAWWMERIARCETGVRWEAWFTDESKVATRG